MADKNTKSKKKQKMHRLELTPKSIFLYGLFLFLLLGWIFVLGVMAGRGYIPEGIKSLIGLETKAGKDQVIEVKGGKGPESEIMENLGQDPKFLYYDELITKKKQAAEKKYADKGKTKEKKRPVQETKPVQPIKKGELYTLQVASLDSEINALKMVNRLKAGGFEAYYTEVHLKGKAYYRVRCGRFETRNEVIDLKKILAQKEGILSSYIAKVTE